MDWMNFQFTSLRKKLSVSFAVASAAALGAVAFVSYQQSRSALMQDARANLGGQAFSVADKIDRNLFERYGDVQAFAFHPGARGGQQEISRAANFFMQAYGLYDLAIVADRNGRIVGVNTVDYAGKPLDTRRLLGRSVKGEDWFESCVNGRVKAGETFLGDAREDAMVAEVYKNRGITMNFAAPVFDGPRGASVVQPGIGRADCETNLERAHGGS